MSVLSLFVGPKSKRDKTLPYTYGARIDMLSGLSDEPLYDYCYADTICGLIEYLDQHQVTPQEVELFGIYRQLEIPLEKEYCLNEEGHWLSRPAICRSLEEHFKESLEEQYRGHQEKQPCSFEDRDRKGSGALGF